MSWRALTALLGVAAGAGALLLAARSLDTVSVRGRSMAPALLPGDRLIVARLRRPPRRGEIVLAADPRARDRELIKRVRGVDAGGVILHGDDPVTSTDGRAFGPLPMSAVRWRVRLRYWPFSRFGPVPSSTATGSDPAAQPLRR